MSPFLCRVFCAKILQNSFTSLLQSASILLNYQFVSQSVCTSLVLTGWAKGVSKQPENLHNTLKRIRRHRSSGQFYCFASTVTVYSACRFGGSTAAAVAQRGTPCGRRRRCLPTSLPRYGRFPIVTSWSLERRWRACSRCCCWRNRCCCPGRRSGGGPRRIQWPTQVCI